MSGKRRNAWLTPNSVTGENLSRCLSFPREFLPYVTGALSALTEPWRWEQYGTMTPAEAAYLATLMLDGFINDCEGTNVLLRQNETAPCILERSDDNGLTWVMFADLSLCSNPKPTTVTYPEEMRLNPTTGELEYSTDDGVTWHDYPTPPGDEPTQPWTPLREVIGGTNDSERKCAAASSAAVSMARMYENTYGAIAAGIANTWGTFANFMNELTDVVFGIQYGAVWDIAKLIVAYEPIVWETNYAAATLTTQQIDDLTCLIFEYTTIDGNGVAQVDFGAVRDNVISVLGVNPGTAVWTQMNYVQEAGLERMMDVGFGTFDCGCEDCAECPGAGYTSYLTYQWNDAALSGGELRRSIASTPVGQFDSRALVSGSTITLTLPEEKCVSYVRVTAHFDLGVNVPAEAYLDGVSLGEVNPPGHSITCQPFSPTYNWVLYPHPRSANVITFTQPTARDDVYFRCVNVFVCE